MDDPGPPPRRAAQPASMRVLSTGPVDQAARWLEWAWHVLVVVLVVVGTIRATTTGGTAGSWIVAGVLAGLEIVAIVTRAWPDFASSRSQHTRRSGAWSSWLDLAGLVVAAVAVSSYPDAYVWLAFPVGLVAFHRLSVPRSVLAGATLAAACLAALARVGPLTGPRILGPVIGLAVAAAGAIAIRTLQTEAERRWQLVVELRETRELVARREREAGILEERTRLARDIHDTVAQGLSSILMLSAAVQRQLLDPPPEVVAHLAQLDDVARDDLAATRRLIDDLAPADLERFDLAHALRRRVDRVRGSTGVEVDLDLDEFPAMSRELEVAVLRIVGQALDNAIAHGRPGRIRISVATVGDRLVVDVHDDGTGFDPRARAGRGIAGMRARADALGGRLTIESHPSDGTVVAAELPVDIRVIQTDQAATASRPGVPIP